MIYNLNRKYASQLKAVLKQSPYKSNNKITKNPLVTIKMITYINTHTQNKKDRRKRSPQNTLLARQK